MADPGKEAVLNKLDLVGVTGFEFEYVQKKGASCAPHDAPFLRLIFKKTRSPFNTNLVQKRMIELWGMGGHTKPISRFCRRHALYYVSGLWLGSRQYDSVRQPRSFPGQVGLVSLVGCLLTRCCSL